MWIDKIQNPKRFLLLSSLTIVIFGAVFVWYGWNAGLHATSDQALQTAEIAVAAFPQDAIAKLRGNASDLEIKEYQHIKTNLQNIISVDPKVRFAYVLVQKAGRIYFVADSEPVSSADYSPPGQEYNEADVITRQPFIDGLAIITKPAADRWGNWVSALVPMKDPVTGKVIALFGMDYPANKWSTAALSHATQSGLMVLVLLSLLYALYAIINSEHKIKESEFNYHTFFETIDDMIIVGDKKGNIIYTNGAVTRKLGYSVKELRRLQVLDLNQKGKRDEAEQIFADIFAGKRTSCPLPLERKNGTLIPSSTRVWLGKWGGQDCIFSISTDLDVEQELLQKFNQVFNDNPALMAISTMTDRKFTDVNQAWLAKLGYTKEEVIGKTAHDLELFNQPEQQVRVAKELTKNGYIHNIELQVKTKTGSILVGDFSGEILESQGNKYFLTVMIDNTERKRAEEALIQNKTKLDLAVKSAHMGVWKYDIINKKRDFDPQACALLGINSATFGGSAEEFYATVHPDDLEKIKTALAKTIARGGTYEPEYRVIWPDKSLHHIAARAELVRGQDAKPQYINGIIWDVTETNKQADAIKELSDYLQNIINSAADPLFVKDDHYRFVIANDALCLMLGMERKNIIGKTLGESLPPDQMEHFLAVDKAVLDSGQANTSEEKLTGKNKKVLTIVTKKTRYVDNKGQRFLVGVIRDITESRRADEETTRKNKQLEALNTAMVGRELKMIELKKEMEQLKKSQKG